MPQPTPVVNATGETIPGGAWMESAGTVDSLGRQQVRKATRTGLAGYVNGFVPIPAGKAGGGYKPFTTGLRLGVHASDTVAASSTLGPTIGDWYCRVGGAGFRPVGATFAGFVPVVAEGGSGTGVLVVHTSAVNDGTAWTAALVYTLSPTDGEIVTGGETVDVKPLGGLLRSGKNYAAVDTGAKSPGTGRRRLRTLMTQLADDILTTTCAGDGTLTTTTVRIPGSADPS